MGSGMTFRPAEGEMGTSSDTGRVGSRIRGNDVMGSGMTFRPAEGETDTSSDTGRLGSRIRGNDVMGSGMTVLRRVRVGSQFRVGG